MGVGSTGGTVGMGSARTRPGHLGVVGVEGMLEGDLNGMGRTDIEVCLGGGRNLRV